MIDTNVVRSLIVPQDQTLRTVFNAQRSYYIDIYQREYKWADVDVRTLLNDIEMRFNEHTQAQTTPDEIKNDVLGRFEPYFLNTYLTCTQAGHIAIVDGQQRLTTLLLILIKLLHVLELVEQDPASRGKTFSTNSLRQLIFETTDFGAPGRFKIYNPNREAAFRALVDRSEYKAETETGRRITTNFEVISKYYDAFFAGDTAGGVNLIKLTYYLCYLLDRISIVEINITRAENVAMIFEVVNDRGVGLKPYEILKGKLLGHLSAEQKEKANEVWTLAQERYAATELRNSTERQIDLDYFFRTFFRAKFADTESEYEKFEGDYHYELYRNEQIRRAFAEFRDQSTLYRWIIVEFAFFADLYHRLRAGYDHEHVLYNKLLDQNQQYLLILSAINTNDPATSEKISVVARKFDQMHVILRLLDVYDSNEFQRLIYPIVPIIRGKNVEEITDAFNAATIKALEEAGVITAGQHARPDELFEYDRFKGIGNKWVNFSKYILMRIDRYLATVLDKPSYASDSDLEELENRFNRNTTRRYGMHLEHIITQHPANRDLFTAGGIFDEGEFNRTRNLLGMLLLLKDKQNISSNNELFRDKLDTYSKSNLIWNELMAGHLDEVDVRNLPAELQLAKIEPTPEGAFPRDKVEDRQRAVFTAIKAIWGNL